jgi:hypothetical protein
MCPKRRFAAQLRSKVRSDHAVRNAILPAECLPHLLQLHFAAGGKDEVEAVRRELPGGFLPNPRRSPSHHRPWSEPADVDFRMLCLPIVLHLDLHRLLVSQLTYCTSSVNLPRPQNGVDRAELVHKVGALIRCGRGGRQPFRLWRGQPHGEAAAGVSCGSGPHDNPPAISSSSDPKAEQRLDPSFANK